MACVGILVVNGIYIPEYIFQCINFGYTLGIRGQQFSTTKVKNEGMSVLLGVILHGWKLGENPRNASR